MRLIKLRIRNFRCFEDQEIAFDRYSCFVGANGSGKSTVLMALNVFFRNTQAPSDVINLQEEDFHRRDTSRPIEVTCVFGELSSAAKEDLKAYVRQNVLTVTAKAEWNAASLRAEVLQIGIRKVMKGFAPYFEADNSSAKASELKDIYKGLSERFPSLPSASTKDTMRSALREYEETHPEQCEDLESNSQFYGWSRGTNLLTKYVQWVYLPAVKDPTEEQDEQRDSALGSLLQRTIRSKVDFSEPLQSLRQKANDEYRQLIDKENSVLVELGQKIEEQLKEWVHPGARVQLNWHFDDQKSVAITDPFARAKVGEGEFLGEIVRSGHGMQRSFLVAMLQVLANVGEGERPTLLLGFEEPELYQHPPQAKHLAALLERLSTIDAQIVITTHSPYFVSSKGYENIRLVRASVESSGSSVTQMTYKQLCSQLAQALGCEPQQPTELMACVEQIMQPSQAELFFCKVAVLVEGPEDVAFLSMFLQHTNGWEEFRRLGCHFVLCEGKTNMSRPLAIANGLGLPVFVVFDGDCDKATAANDDEHRRDNGCLLSLLGSKDNPIQEGNLFGHNVVMWRTRIMDEVMSEIGREQWDATECEARATFKLQSGVRRKNPMLVTATVESLLRKGVRMPSLESAVGALLRFARAASTRVTGDSSSGS
jgi:putative ATP-dependent endonuclease of the OLD family